LLVGDSAHRSDTLPRACRTNLLTLSALSDRHLQAVYHQTLNDRNGLLTDDERQALPADAFEPVRYVSV